MGKKDSTPDQSLFIKQFSTNCFISCIITYNLLQLTKQLFRPQVHSDQGKFVLRDIAPYYWNKHHRILKHDAIITRKNYKYLQIKSSLLLLSNFMSFMELCI